jgi:lysophospholipase L1-like esterase
MAEDASSVPRRVPTAAAGSQLTASVGENRAPTPRTRRRWAFLLTAVLLGLVLAAIALELAFRFFWQPPAWFTELQLAGMYVGTPEGGMTLQPGWRGMLQAGDAAPVTVSINNLGMRGAELGAKVAGERRVLMAGDSLVFGYGVEARDSLPEKLEAALRTGEIKATVGNAGVPGYGCSHAASHLARIDPRFQADALVLCGFLGNDATDEVSPQRTVYAGLMLSGPMARLVHTSWRARLAIRSRAALWLEAWILTYWPSLSLLTQLPPDAEDEKRRAGMPSEPKQHAGLFLDVIDERKTWEPGTPPLMPRLVAQLRTALQRALEVAGQRPLVFVVLPTVWQVVEPKRVAELQRLELVPAEYERGRAQSRWMTVAKELGIPAFDATAILAAEPDPEQLFIKDGGHLSVRGNEVVAKWLATELLPLLR